MEINRYQTRKPKRLAVVTMGVKLGDETRGYPLLTHLRQVVQRLNPDAILLGEVDVAVEDYRHRSSIGTRRIATRRKHATETFPTT